MKISDLVHVGECSKMAIKDEDKSTPGTLSLPIIRLAIALIDAVEALFRRLPIFLIISSPAASPHALLSDRVFEMRASHVLAEMPTQARILE